MVGLAPFLPVCTDVPTLADWGTQPDGHVGEQHWGASEPGALSIDLHNNG